MKAVLFDFFGTLAEYQPDRRQLAAPETFEIARALGFGGDQDAFTAIWDGASAALETTARVSLREFSMTDAAMAFGRDAGLELSIEDAQRLGRARHRNKS